MNPPGAEVNKKAAMDDLLYDEVKENSLMQDSVEDDEQMGDIDALLQSEKSKMTTSQKRTMDSSVKEHSSRIEEKKERSLKRDESEMILNYVEELTAKKETSGELSINYEEESFEEMKTASPSPSKRVQSANLGSSVRFQGVEDKEESRPKSSPAGKTRKEESSDDKLPSAVSSPIGKAEPKQLFNPVGKGEGSAESKRSDTLRTPARSMGAPSTRAFQYATPGYTGSPTKSAGRRRLEYVLENIHARKKVSKYMTGKMKTFKNALSTGQVTEHQRWTYTEDGVKVEATPPFSMELQHHTVSDYRSFRPTSANKRLMPSKDRDPSQFLLPGQKKTEDLRFYDGKKLRSTMHDSMAKAMTKVEKCYNAWDDKVHSANHGQQKRLHAIHKVEMDELCAYFEGYTPSEFMCNLLSETKYPQHLHGKHVMVTLEDKDYVGRQLAAQAQHNENRMHVLRTHVKNRHRDEVQAIKENTRAPLELLTRIRHTQEEVLEETAKKVINKIIHAEKIVKTIHGSRDPTVLLRAQKAEEHCMTLARIGIKRMAEIAEGIEDVFEEALLDYIEGDREIAMVRVGGKDGKLEFSGTGKAKTDTIRPHSSTYTPQVFDRKINGYRYRSRSPPRGSPQKDIETEERLSRPKPLSARKGKLHRSRHDILIHNAQLPFASKQYSKGREGKEQPEMPRLWTSTRFAREKEERRPNTAPAGVVGADATGLDGVSPRDAWDEDERGEAKETGKKKKRRPMTAAVVRADGESKSGNDMAGARWDPSTGHLEGGLAFDDGRDDDASLGIMQDLGDDASIADSIGEGGVFEGAMSGEDLEKAKLEKRRSLATARELAVMERKAKEKNERDRLAKKLAPKQRVPDNPTDELCAECDKFFGGKSKFPLALTSSACDLSLDNSSTNSLSIYIALITLANHQ